MEQLGQGYGYVLYSTIITDFTSPQVLQISGMQDRALAYVDGVLQGAVGWNQRDPFWQVTLRPSGARTQRIDILVENKGRCSGNLVDFNCARKVTGSP